MKSRKDFDSDKEYLQYQRTLIAALAMQGMIAGITKFRSETGMEEIIIHRPKDIAEISLVYADELLNQLSKP